MLLFLTAPALIGGGELDVERAGKGMEFAAASGVGEKEVESNVLCRGTDASHDRGKSLVSKEKEPLKAAAEASISEANLPSSLEV